MFETYRPDIVYHAAAHKHVPLMETSPNEAIKNNVIGTYKTACAALKYGAKKFVLISTDKAVNPTNIMGASKRLCEMVIQSMDVISRCGRQDLLPVLFAHGEDGIEQQLEHLRRSAEKADREQLKVESVKSKNRTDTQFVAVRFGNVLGSNGSVIPLFKKQIEAGGPVTVTHPDIIRYFMTIPEAVSLVLLAGTYAWGGEIFVLDMGDPVKIDTLARNLIRLSGYKPDVDIKIEYTGLRPGEKLFEEKLMAEEGLLKTDNKMIHIGKPIPFDLLTFLDQLAELAQASYHNDPHIVEMVEQMVPTFHPVGDKPQAIQNRNKKTQCWLVQAISNAVFLYLSANLFPPHMHQMRDARYALALLRRGCGHQCAGRHKENIFSALRDPCGSKYVRTIHRLSIRIRSRPRARPVPRGQIESAAVLVVAQNDPVFAQQFV